MEPVTSRAGRRRRRLARRDAEAVHRGGGRPGRHPGLLERLLGQERRPRELAAMLDRLARDRNDDRDADQSDADDHQSDEDL